MSNILDMLNDANSIGRNKQDDENLITSLSKLIRIANMIVDSYEGFISLISVSPMHLITTKMSDVKRVKFYIQYNKEFCKDVSLHTLKKECEEFIQAFVSDEFEGATIEKSYYSEYYDWKCPTIMLYSTYYHFSLDDFSNYNYLLLYKLVTENDIAITVSELFEYEMSKRLFFHIQSATMVNSTRRALCNQIGALGYSIAESEDYKDEDVCYVLLIGKDAIEYNIPYLYIDKTSFDEQRINSLLNTNVD